MSTGQGWYDIKNAKDADVVRVDEGWLRISVPAKGTAVFCKK